MSSDVDRLLGELHDALIVEYRAADDPFDRIAYAKRRMPDVEALVTLTADMRARAVAELHVDGWSYAKVAAKLGVSRAAVQQLNERGRGVSVRRRSERPAT